MSFQTTLKRTGFVAAALFGLGVAASAQASDEALYKQYHSAIKAAEMCQGASHDQDAHQKMAAVIDEKAGTDMETGLRLSWIDQAKNDTYWLVFKNRCNSESVASLLELYNADLAPALAS